MEMTATEQWHKQLWNAGAGRPCVRLNRDNTICANKDAAYVSAINDKRTQPGLDVNVELMRFPGEIIIRSHYFILYLP